jgi:hypothetical protein
MDMSNIPILPEAGYAHKKSFTCYDLLDVFENPAGSLRIPQFSVFRL